MNGRVSSTQIETQGRGERTANAEHRPSRVPPDQRSYDQVYRTILLKELLISEFQESYTKYF